MGSGFHSFWLSTFSEDRLRITHLPLFRKMTFRISGGRTPRAGFEPTRPAIDPYKSLGRERGGVWGGEREPFFRRVPSPLPNGFPSTKAS